MYQPVDETPPLETDCAARLKCAGLLMCAFVVVGGLFFTLWKTKGGGAG